MLLSYYTLHMETVEQALMRRAVRSYRKLIRLIRDGDVQGAVDNWRATMTYTLRSRDSDVPITTGRL